MATSTGTTLSPRSPLEEFLRDYVETTGGACDEVEPQVYDVLLPSAGPESSAGPENEFAPGGGDILRVAFDPEAIPEHPGAQLASLGTPLVDALLNGAVRRGRCARVYMNGLNLAPHDLPGRVRRALSLAEGLELEIERVRPLDFAQTVFWFESTFISDQKEHDILVVAIDLHSGREVRHLDRLLDFERLGEQPSLPLVEARRASVAAVYPVAQKQVLRTLASLANARRRELTGRLDRQIDRMCRYYSDMRSELEEQVNRARRRNQDVEKFAARRQALDREERLRVSELRQKNALRVELQLISLLVIMQPKLSVRSMLIPTRRRSDTMEVELVWDPLTECLQAVPCPRCGSPAFSFQLDYRSRVVCEACAGSARKAK